MVPVFYSIDEHIITNILNITSIFLRLGKSSSDTKIIFYIMLPVRIIKE